MGSRTDFFDGNPPDSGFADYLVDVSDLRVVSTTLRDRSFSPEHLGGMIQPSNSQSLAVQQEDQTLTYILTAFAAIGLLAISALGVGLYLDASEFDQTRGGYEAPYEGVTGQPVDWFAMDRTPTGLAKRGRVVNVLVDGKTGMISFEAFGLVVDFRTFSDRALAVHKPREALIAMGFEPEF
ncbi:MAG: hypothetical protein GY798_15620 [Hyphomicrobiales bacterium]|nr:hypothetical protein [Hyphomicrobiales bacterium]